MSEKKWLLITSFLVARVSKYQILKLGVFVISNWRENWVIHQQWQMASEIDEQTMRSLDDLRRDDESEREGQAMRER